ncbi:YopX family protein [Streptococcus suis]|uniref:YopX family protein n=1 Tax=Streptococcus suis TaxID=1307 RepID=UPI0004924456|nr:YopX family protein [Streptococcus suis]
MIPKFRAWDKISHAWRHDIYIGLDGLAKDLSRTGEEPFELPLDNVILMQSTGLFDKNGKEIFEGDVVSFEDASDNENVFVNKGVVEICQLGWHFSNRVSVDMEDLLDGHVLDCEIIGNIYENPELVEAEND